MTEFPRSANHSRKEEQKRTPTEFQSTTKKSYAYLQSWANWTWEICKPMNQKNPHNEGENRRAARQGTRGKLNQVKSARDELAQETREKRIKRKKDRETRPRSRARGRELSGYPAHRGVQKSERRERARRFADKDNNSAEEARRAPREALPVPARSASANQLYWHWAAFFEPN